VLRVDPLANPERAIQRIYSYVAYRIGDGPDAEDITSDTIERALRYQDSYDGSRGDPAAWLVGIARRSISDFFARQTELTAEAVDSAADGDLEAETARRLAVTEAMKALSDRERDLIALRYGADLTARAIGELLGLRTHAVEVALQRALGRLRAALGGERGGEEVQIPAQLPVRIGPSGPV
jgi:RNA polymerase sigma-70 factor (ECF subfamily)